MTSIGTPNLPHFHIPEGAPLGYVGLSSSVTIAGFSYRQYIILLSFVQLSYIPCRKTYLRKTL